MAHPEQHPELAVNAGNDIDRWMGDRERSPGHRFAPEYHEQLRHLVLRTAIGLQEAYTWERPAVDLDLYCQLEALRWRWLAQAERLGSYWDMGEGLSMRPFRSIALMVFAQEGSEDLVDEAKWHHAMVRAESNTRALRRDLAAGKAPTLPPETIVLPTHDRPVAVGHLTDLDRIELTLDEVDA